MRLFGRARGAFARQSIVRLEPIEVDQVSHALHLDASGDEVEFDIPSYRHAAWAEVVLAATAEPAVLATLLVDRGNGFDEANAYRLGYLRSEFAQLRRFVPLRGARRVRLHLSAAPRQFRVHRLDIRATNMAAVAAHAAALAVRHQGGTEFARQVTSGLTRSGFRGVRRGLAAQLGHQDQRLAYQQWIEHASVSGEHDPLPMRVRAVNRRPTFSVLVTVVDGDVRFLARSIDSVRRQRFVDWQLCLAVDRRYAESVTGVLSSLRSEIRATVRVEDFGRRFDRATNRALDLARGEFVCLLNLSDELTEDALLHADVALSARGYDILYSDEDIVETDGSLSRPRFKPDWSPETLLSNNYVGRLCVYRRSLVTRIGGLHGEGDVAADHDLLLRGSEVTQSIGHLPRVLYHRRVSRSLAQPEVKAVQRVLEDALQRRGLTGAVRAYRRNPGHFSVRVDAPQTPKISIIIPVRDQPVVLDQCLSSVFKRTTYGDFEVIVINNRSQEAATHRLLQRWQGRAGKHVSVIDCDFDFNFARLMNVGVAASDAQLVVLLNSDTVVVTPNWLEAMAGYAMLPNVACVGAKLVYPDYTIQHGGVILVGGVAGHSHRGHVATAPGYCGRLLGASNYSAVTAACMMMQRRLFHEVGGFDEALAVAFNDVDFCLRALTMGYRHVCLGDVELVHHESKTRGHDTGTAQRARFAKEVALMRNRWARVLDDDPYYSPHLTQSAEDFAVAPTRRVRQASHDSWMFDSDLLAVSDHHAEGSGADVALQAIVPDA
jgi:GT2 family glycosyltransferase